ncbi:MAG: hypothetical protein ACRDON_06785 [Gaiellaceae bacterium]
MFWRRNRDVAVGDVGRDKVIERQHKERARGGPPLVRGLMTLLGVAAAGFLIWLATLFELNSTGDYWTAMAILAGAGAALGLSQLLGGWTKWGVPTISPGVFLLGFLPAFVAVGGILVATRPTGTEEGQDVAGWIRDIGLGGLAEDLSLFQGVLAFGLGLVFSFVLDTAGPRTQTVENRETVVPEDEVHDYQRREVVTTAPTTERTVVRDRELT